LDFVFFLFFFFQAEDGIRDDLVTGVQTCALPIWDEIALFLGQDAEGHVYWVERTGKTQRIIALNAAPIDVAEYLRRRLFRSDTSVIMTSATLATSVKQIQNPKSKIQNSKLADTTAGEIPHSALRTPHSALDYFARRVGA